MFFVIDVEIKLYDERLGEHATDEGCSLKICERIWPLLALSLETSDLSHLKKSIPFAHFIKS